MTESKSGQESEVYLFVVNLIGLGIGPTAVALLTDRLFADDQAVGFSMFTVTAVTMASAWCFFRRADRQSDP